MSERRDINSILDSRDVTNVDYLFNKIVNKISGVEGVYWDFKGFKKFYITGQKVWLHVLYTKYWYSNIY